MLNNIWSHEIYIQYTLLMQWGTCFCAATFQSARLHSHNLKFIFSLFRKSYLCALVLAETVYKERDWLPTLMLAFKPDVRKLRNANVYSSTQQSKSIVKIGLEDLANSLNSIYSVSGYNNIVNSQKQKTGCFRNSGTLN